MQHIFLDVEALGAPGMGSPFAVGAAGFDMEGIRWRWHRNIRISGRAIADPETLAWLSEREPEVLAQLRGGFTFGEVWLELISMLNELSMLNERKNEDEPAVTFWADDFSDFAWLDLAARQHGLLPLRTFGPQYDSSALVALAESVHTGPRKRRDGPRLDDDARRLIEHYAEHDAVRGAMDLIWALQDMGRFLP
jgi:hypothetical protein